MAELVKTAGMSGSEPWKAGKVVLSFGMWFCVLCGLKFAPSYSVFENSKHRYLGKIKIADYIVELTQNKSLSKEYLLEVDEVIESYNQNSHKTLMKMLIEERKNYN